MNLSPLPDQEDRGSILGDSSLQHAPGPPDQDVFEDAEEALPSVPGSVLAESSVQSAKTSAALTSGIHSQLMDSRGALVPGSPPESKPASSGLRAAELQTGAAVPLTEVSVTAEEERSLGSTKICGDVLGRESHPAIAGAESLPAVGAVESQSRTAAGVAPASVASGVRVLKVVWTGKTLFSTSQVATGRAISEQTSPDSRNLADIAVKLPPSITQILSQVPAAAAASKAPPSKSSQNHIPVPVMPSTRTVVIRPSSLPARTAPQSVTVSAAAAVSSSQQTVVTVPEMLPLSAQAKVSQSRVVQVVPRLPPSVNLAAVSVPSPAVLARTQGVSSQSSVLVTSPAHSRMTVNPTSCITLARSSQPVSTSLIGQPQVLQPISMVGAVPAGLQSGPAVIAKSSSQPILLKIPSATSTMCVTTTGCQSAVKVVSPLPMDFTRVAVNRSSSPGVSLGSDAPIFVSSSRIGGSRVTVPIHIPSVSSSLVSTEPSSKKGLVESPASRSLLGKTSADVTSRDGESSVKLMEARQFAPLTVSVDNHDSRSISNEPSHRSNADTGSQKILEVPQTESGSGLPIVTIIAHSQEEMMKQIERNIRGGVESSEQIPVIIIDYMGRGEEEEGRSSVGLQSGPAAFQCEECDYSSNNKYYLRQHTALVHSGQRPFKCPFCDYAGKRSHSLREHLVVHSNDRPFECRHCNATFRKKGHLTNHVKLHTSVQASSVRYQCPHCSFISDLERLTEHSKQHQLSSTPLEVGPVVGATQLGSEVKPVLVKCSVCGCTAATMDAMRVHMWEHIPNVQEAEDPSPNPTEKKVQAASMTSIMNQPLPENAAFKCSECSFVSREASVFIRHMLSHKAKHSQEQQRRSQEQLSQQQEPPSPATQLPQRLSIHLEPSPKDQGQQPECIVVCQEPENQNPKEKLSQTLKAKCKPDPCGGDDAQSQKGVAGKENTCRNAESTPFVHDPVAKRFRCTLCGYTCEYQRTIKAHIWKHSGNKDIDYPMFQNGPLSVYDDVPTDRLVAPSATAADNANSHPSIVRILNSAPAHLQHHSSLPASQQASSQVASHSDLEASVDLRASGTVSVAHVVRVVSPGLVAACRSVCPSGPVTPGQAVKRTLAIVQDGPGHSQTVKAFSAMAACTSAASGAGLGVVCPAKTETSGVTPVSSSLDSSCDFFAQDDQGVPAVISSVAVAESTLEQGVESSGSGALSLQSGENVAETSPSCPGETPPGSSATVEIEQSVESSAVAELFQPDSLRTELDQALASPDSTAEEASPGLEVVLEVTDSLDSADLGEAGMEGTLKKVVVEAVDSVGSDFTGLRSQQCSPRHLDLNPSEDSGIASDAASPPKPPVAAETSEANFPPAAAEVPVGETVKSDKTDNALTLLSLLKKEKGGGQLSPECTKDGRNSDDEKVLIKSEGGMQEEGEKSGSDKPKSGGICSSLLAVIEQLRERSVSESDGDVCPSGGRKTVGRGTRSRRGRGRKLGQGEDIPLEAVENIERLENAKGEVTFRCRLCHYTSPRALFIRLHMRLHKSKPPSECSLCDYSAPSSEALQDHMIQHCKVRTYQCKLCPSAFNYKSQLRAHMRAHIEREPHSCQVCGFCATSPSGLRKHMRLHLKRRQAGEEVAEDEDEENEELRCLHCDFSAASPSQLTLHAGIHAQTEPLRCQECDFTAVSSRSLKSHMKRHTNDQRYVQQPLEQYKCNLCGYVCHHLPSLKSHMWRHAADKNYSYEFTNDIINAAIDYDWRQDTCNPPSETELLERVLTTERKIAEGSLGSSKPVCWVTFRCCQCGFETINKATLNVHMRSHSDIIQQTFDVIKPLSPAQSSKRPMEDESMDAPLSKMVKVQD